MLHLLGSGTAYKEGMKIKDRIDAMTLMTPATLPQAFVPGWRAHHVQSLSALQCRYRAQYRRRLGTAHLLFHSHFSLKHHALRKIHAGG